MLKAHQSDAHRNHAIWQHGTFSGFVYILCILTFVLIVSVITPIIALAYFMQVGPFCEHTNGENATGVSMKIEDDHTFEDNDFDF
jgi:hypothetical protein